MNIDIIALIIMPALSALIGALVAGGYGRVKHATGDAMKQNKAIASGMRNIMRDKIIDAYDKHINKEEPLDMERMISIDRAYECYHALGGNGTITHLYEEIKERGRISI